jgi:hypothetical protein
MSMQPENRRSSDDIQDRSAIEAVVWKQLADNTYLYKAPWVSY